MTNEYLRNWALLWEVPLLRSDPAPGKMLEGEKSWPRQWQGLFSFQALSRDNVYHSTEHLVSMSAWNNPSCTGTLSKIISICMWHSLNYHTQTFLVWTAFRHSATSFCRPDLSAPHSESHVGHCNHLSERKKNIPEYKLEWIQLSCDCVLFIVCFIDFSTDTLYSVFCKYHQQHNLSLLKWECKNFLMLMVLFINCFFFFFFWKVQSSVYNFLRTLLVSLETLHTINEGYTVKEIIQNITLHYCNWFF